MHSVQADCTFGSPHVEAYSETMWDVVVHSLLHTTTKLCNSNKEMKLAGIRVAERREI